LQPCLLIGIKALDGLHFSKGAGFGHSLMVKIAGFVFKWLPTALATVVWLLVPSVQVLSE